MTGTIVDRVREATECCCSEAHMKDLERDVNHMYNPQSSKWYTVATLISAAVFIFTIVTNKSLIFKGLFGAVTAALGLKTRWTVYSTHMRRLSWHSLLANMQAKKYMEVSEQLPILCTFPKEDNVAPKGFVFPKGYMDKYYQDHPPKINYLCGTLVLKAVTLITQEGSNWQEVQKIIRMAGISITLYQPHSRQPILRKHLETLIDVCLIIHRAMDQKSAVDQLEDYNREPVRQKWKQI